MSHLTIRARVLLGVCACLLATTGLVGARTVAARAAAPAAAAAAAAATAVQPDLYNLRGGRVTINYATSSLDGQPRLTYGDGSRTLNFVGDQIMVADTAMGFLVTVQIEAVPDLRTTTFTIVIPRINLEPGQTVPVRTQGITTVERSSIAPQTLRGQLQTYRVTPLTGTAQFVYF
jgi:hypothetical protein